MLVETVASFKQEIADVRRKIEPSGEVADNASPALASIRERLRRQKQRLRTTLDGFLRGRDAKYLQEQVVTDRNGRHVLMVRAEHRAAIPGIVHGGSASGASLFVEPLETVEINNDIVALEEQEAEEVRRILLELTDAFRRRPDELERTIEVATELDVIQARARFSIMVGGVEPVIAADGTFDLMAARHPLLMAKVGGNVEEPVPVDIHMRPPTRVLIITGPNTGGKTVALKTAGLFVAMAQAGLHVPGGSGFEAAGLQIALRRHRRRAVDLGEPQHVLRAHREHRRHEPESGAAGARAAGRSRRRNRSGRRRRARYRRDRPLPHARGPSRRHDALRLAEVVRLDHGRRGKRGVWIQSGDLRADVFACSTDRPGAAWPSRSPRVWACRRRSWRRRGRA